MKIAPLVTPVPEAPGEKTLDLPFHYRTPRMLAFSLWFECNMQRSKKSSQEWPHVI